MSYTRPSPRPGELYDRFGPPRPSTGNSYARSEAGEARPSRPPYPYPMAEPSYRGASTRPGQRYHDDAPFDRPPAGRPVQNKLYSRGSEQSHFDYPRHPSRPSAMTEDRSWQPRKPTGAVRPHDPHHYDSSFSRREPPRHTRPRSADDDHFGRHQPGQALENKQDLNQDPADYWSWNKIKKTVWGDPDSTQHSDHPPEDDRDLDDHPPDTQNTLWTKLTTVGASFQKKLHGNDGNASDASDYEGESHLIRIMKKYHTDNAESAHDLPDWLFSQDELREAHASLEQRPLASSHRAGRYDEGEHRPGRYDEYADEEPWQGGGGGRGRLADIYDSVDQGRSSHSRTGSTTTKQSFDSGYGSSSNAPRRRGRYEDPRPDPEPKPSLGRNRLAINSDHRQHPPTSRRPSDPAYHDQWGPRGPVDRYPDPRRPRNTPPRGPGPPLIAPTVVDYFRPSGQDNRYPAPRSKY